MAIFVLFAVVLVLMYFTGLTVQGFMIGFVVAMAGLLVFSLRDHPKG